MYHLLHPKRTLYLKILQNLLGKARHTEGHTKIAMITSQGELCLLSTIGRARFLMRTKAV